MHGADRARPDPLFGKRLRDPRFGRTEAGGIGGDRSLVANLGRVRGWRSRRRGDALAAIGDRGGELLRGGQDRRIEVR